MRARFVFDCFLSYFYFYVRYALWLFLTVVFEMRAPLFLNATSDMRALFFLTVASVMRAPFAFVMCTFFVCF